MQYNKLLREKIKAKKSICGTHVNLKDSALTEIVSGIGFDFIWLDMEHTCFSYEDARMHILAAHKENCPIIIRVPVHDLTFTKKILEMGPDGIIFPMVEDYEDAKEVISWTLYPPYGKRGAGPKGAVRYGLDNEKEFYGNPHIDNTLRFIQIENKTAVDDIDKIKTIPYLDGCIIGPFDLSGSINQLGNVFGEDNMVLIKKIIAGLKDSDKIVGVSTFATDEKTLKLYHDLGINMISSGADYVHVLEQSKITLERLKKIHK